MVADRGKASAYHTERIKAKRYTKWERPLAVAQLIDQRITVFSLNCPLTGIKEFYIRAVRME
jgi:hypothetical protein